MQPWNRTSSENLTQSKSNSPPYPEKLFLGQVTIAVGVNQDEELLRVLRRLLLGASSHCSRHISVHHRVNGLHNPDHFLLVNCPAVVYIVPLKNEMIILENDKSYDKFISFDQSFLWDGLHLHYKEIFSQTV